MTRDEFLAELATVLNEEPGNVKPEVEVESLKGWDSTGLLGVIALLDGDLDITADVDHLRRCKTIQDLIDLTGDKVV